MNGGPEKRRVVRRWIAKAEEDILAAECLLKLGRHSPLGLVGFHAQQCAEKYLKALLLQEGLAVPRVHDLNVLVRSVPPTRILGLNPEELSRLSRYVIEGRYPDEWEPIRRPQVRKAIAIAKRIRKVILLNLPHGFTPPKR
jgi:HEPN domain-containing protein